MQQEARNIIFFDGVCNLCNSSVQFILKRDTRQQFHFASLQSDFASDYLKSFTNLPENLDSIVYVEGNNAYYKSTAVFRIAHRLGGLYRFVNIFKVFPRKFTDWLYDLIADNRYRWFGRKESCMVPDPSVKSRFLD